MGKKRRILGKMKHLDIGCQIKGCPNKAQFLIGSLTRELQGKDKWLYVCDKCEEEVARQNIQIADEAEKLGATIAEHIARSPLLHPGRVEEHATGSQLPANAEE
ncbi:hypothetical protein COV21_02375 [Candidatus Woesearchaeota archaeon CG10_big_fil_rev_8_21_14_0_10_45_5]|nr:MAG: hypothetical protein COV21_02375 [Candidatus Woesearchaeota archaeon CG10_big_fil_rev_8_21_14_0_10_45_5]